MSQATNSKVKLYLKELPAILDTEPYSVYVIDDKGTFIRRATKEDCNSLQFYVAPPKYTKFSIFKNSS